MTDPVVTATVETEEEYDPTVDILKVVFMLAMFGVCYIGISSTCHSNTKCLSMLNCFVAGILTSFALIHIIPHCQDAYAEYTAEHMATHIEDGEEAHDHGYPLPFVLTFVGYMLIVLVERVMGADYFDKDAALGGKKADIASVAPRGDKAADDSTAPVAGGDGTARGALEIEGAAADSPQSGMCNAMALISIIGVSALFEGAALGMLNEMDIVLQIGIGITLRKIPQAVALGASLKRAGFSSGDTTKLLTFFGMVGPLGAIFGMLFLSMAGFLIHTILFGFIAGVYLYIGCSDIIVKDFESGKDVWGKFFLVTIGGVIIALLEVLHVMTHAH